MLSGIPASQTSTTSCGAQACRTLIDCATRANGFERSVSCIIHLISLAPDTPMATILSVYITLGVLSAIAFALPGRSYRSHE